MNQQTDKVVENYLRRLERDLEGLPRARRHEILDEIQDHIDEARAELGPDNEGELRTLLDRVGEPADIADEARRRFDVPRGRFGFRETAALILLPIGGVVLPVLGWIVGVVLLWTSGAWTNREKLAGTLLPPGGLLLPLGALTIGGTSGEEGCGGRINPTTGAVIDSSCADGGGTTALQILGIAVLVVAVVLAIATPVWLGSRLRKRLAD
jgi:hypothetical protein